MTPALPTRELVDIVGRAHVLDQPDLVQGFAVDWTRRFHGSTAAVIRPGSTAEVAALLACCRRHGLAVVPQGGNTGLVGGGIAYDGAITLSLTRLTECTPIEGDDTQVSVADRHS